MDRRDLLKSAGLPLMLPLLNPFDICNIPERTIKKDKIPFRNHYKAKMFERDFLITNVKFPSITQEVNEFCYGYLYGGRISYGDLSFTIYDDLCVKDMMMGKSFSIKINLHKKDSVEAVVSCDGYLKSVNWRHCELNNIIANDLEIVVKNLSYHSIPKFLKD